MDNHINSLTTFTENSLRTILNTLPSLVWLKDTQGVYLACNKRFEDFFGALEQDIVGRTDYDFVSKELADTFRENDLLVIQRGTISVNEEWITFASDGHRELLETSKMPLLNEKGELVGVLGISHDITLRKQLEKYEKFRSSTLELLAGSAALNDILESIVHGVELLHPDMLCSILLLE